MSNLSLSRTAPFIAAFVIVAIFLTLAVASPNFPVATARFFETSFLGLAFTVLLASRFLPVDRRHLVLFVWFVVVGMFAWKLGALWSAGGGNEYALGGLLPYNDATGYYDEARYFLENGRLKEMNVGRRPISSVVLAALLGLGNLNLQVALALLVAVTTMACLVLARAVAWRYGWTAALVFAAVFYAYIDTYVGTTLSESAGLALGSAGLALAWTGAGTKRLPVFALGLGILTLGLLARAGAFFVLPALLIWAACHFQAQVQDTRWQRRFSWQVLIVGGGAIVAGFAFNKLLLAGFAPHDHVVFSNFPWTLYGVAVGGKGWTQVLVDHPGIADLEPSARIEEIYRLIWAAIRDNPINFVRGILHQYNEFFFNSGWHKFIADKAVRGLAQVSALAALWVIFRRRRQRWEEGFLFAALVGLFASIPALADGGPRVYAATQGLTAFVVAVGASTLVTALTRRPPANDDNQLNVVGVPVAFGLALLALLATGIALSSNFAPTRHVAATHTCPTGQRAIAVRLLPATFVHVQADDALAQTRAPDVRVSDFRAGIGAGGAELHRAIKRQSAPFILLSAHAKAAQAARWVIVPTAILPPVPSTLEICGLVEAPVTRAVSWKVK